MLFLRCEICRAVSFIPQQRDWNVSYTQIPRQTFSLKASSNLVVVIPYRKYVLFIQQAAYSSPFLAYRLTIIIPLMIAVRTTVPM